mgnify:CR=1 FL=1
MKTIAIVLRADKVIGTGHLMRVLSILKYLDNFNFVLISDELDENLAPLLNKFSSIYRVNLSEIPKTIKAISPSLVLIDHYFIDEEIEAKIKQYFKVVVIDDLSNRHHCAHALIDQGLCAKEDDYKDLLNDNAKIYVGPKYATVKELFCKISPHKLEGMPHILVSFGGSDPVDACGKTLNGILSCKLYLNFSFTIVSGLANPQYQNLKTMCAGHSNIKLLKYCNDMPKLFSICDGAIGACGGMLYERIASGLVALNVVIADNQNKAPFAIEKYKLGLNYALCDLEDGLKLQSSLEKLLANKESYAKNGKNIVDGKGLLRIAKIIKDLTD